ncbi:MAG: hypothetical protein IJB19_02315 [Clostridia bacterium]|nr:hypothetical protein [Clostridia bacterium]
MKKVFLMFCAAVLAVTMLSIGAYAAETVIYENDFSDPATLSDFKAYRFDWEIRDGGLHLTETSPDGTAVDNTFSHIIYQSKETLTDYIVEVDYMNVQTAGGIIFRADQASVDTQGNGFYGYVAFIANDAAKGAIGCGETNGGWKGNINVGTPSTDCSVGVNAHIRVIVKGDKIKVDITNKDNGNTIYSYLYTIGESDKDAKWLEGTVGLRMRTNYTAGNVSSIGTAYYDNFKVTTANEVDEKDMSVVAAVSTLSIDTSNLVTVYTNNFDTEDSIKDFKQYGGTWTVYDGKLYLSAAADTQSHILYNGYDALKNLTDYVLDVDMYNTQTQAGAIVRSDINAAFEGTNAFCGYIGFISFDGKLGAIGYGTSDGGWGGNLEVSTSVLTPGSNIHLQVAVKGNLLQYTMTEQETGKVIWTFTKENDYWQAGTFGFRMYSQIKNDLDNINNTAFDNLKISVYSDSEVPVLTKGVELKMTVGKTDYTLNGEQKTMDVAPIIINSRTMLPVRYVAEALGAEISWDGATSTATLKTADTEIKITVGAAEAIVNGQAVKLDSPAVIEKDRSFMPVRFVAETLGGTVAWDGATSTATITK